MTEFSSFLSSLAPRVIAWLGWLATLAAIVLFGWIVAGVFWELAAPYAPEPVLAVDTDPARVAQTVAARHIFGDARADVTTAVTNVVGVKLFGVVAPTGRTRVGIAILSVQGKPAVAVREGEEIADGVRLQRVLARSVEISRGGQVQELALPDRGKT